jgi:hypothetical protein
MLADPESQPPTEPDPLEEATDQAIAACGGNARDAVKALLVANEFLQAQIERATCRRLEWLRAWQVWNRSRATGRIGMSR